MFPQILFAQDVLNDLSLFDEYMILLNDLVNSNTNGYRSHQLDVDYSNFSITDEPRGVRNINFSQGPIQFTNRDLDFAIIGEGFFKINLPDGTIAYTRSGEFVIDGRTNELVTVNGRYRLFDPIRIESGYIRLLLNEDHSIITIYPNGDEINNGRLNIYYLDTNELRYFNDFSARGILFYNGDIENIGDGRIEHRCIEQSNVLSVWTMTRLVIISKRLGMNFRNNVE
ncbi:MAG: hypothetical protein LBI28_01460 [Treponema sp.]|nr:hypothetical protein [Treponema sp.]